MTDFRKCPKCGLNSITEIPGARIMRNGGVDGFTIGRIYHYGCLNPRCAYREEDITEYNEYGKRLQLPWYKRIFQ